MGRHSAPDEDDESAVDRALAPLHRDRPRPARHGGADDGDGADAPSASEVPDGDERGPHGARPAARPRDLQAAAEQEALAEARARAAAEREDTDRGKTDRTYEDVDTTGEDDPVTGPIGIIQAALARSRPRPDGTPGTDPSPPSAPPEADAHPEVDDRTDRTDRIAPVTDPVLDQPRPEAVTTELRAVLADAPHPNTEQAPEASVGLQAEPPTDADRATGSPSDWALLKARPALRARVAAALLVPFVLYVVVLLTLDAWDVRTGLIWIWIPLVSAGVVAGLLLDLAHRTSDRRTG